MDAWGLIVISIFTLETNMTTIIEAVRKDAPEFTPKPSTLYHPRPEPVEGDAPARQIPIRTPRISDVARMAGVSTATVSMVMHDNPRISRATSKRVRATAERLGYRPNRAAQSLRGVRTRTLAAFLPASDQGLADLYIGELLNGIRDAAHTLGYRLLLERSTPPLTPSPGTLADPEHSRRAGEGWGEGRALSHSHFDSKEIDAILCIGCTVADIPHDLLDLPLLLVDSRPARSRIDHVACDYRGGMQQAVNYLTQLGHRNIALIRPATPDHRGPELLSAFRDALSAQPDLSSTHLAAPLAGRVPTPHPIALAESTPSEQGGSQAAHELFERHPHITAIIAAADRMSAGVLHQLALRGLSCPLDISVMTLGDIGPSAFSTPGLTAIHLPLRAVGAAACEKIIQRLSGEVSNIAELLPTNLILRGSTGLA